VLGDQGCAASEENALSRGQTEEELRDADLEAGQGQSICIAAAEVTTPGPPEWS
jgi:hypothetical protein